MVAKLAAVALASPTTGQGYIFPRESIGMVSTPLAKITASQFFQGIYWPLDESAPGTQPAAPVPPAVAAATQTLLQIVQTLSASGGGWPADKPLTPESLLPYVTDEAEELWERLQVLREPSAVSPAAAMRETSLEGTAPQLLFDLSTVWLWAIAASAPAAMKLLEGVSAYIPDHPEAAGVRLVPMLTIWHDEDEYCLDLATQSIGVPNPVFAPQTVVQFSDYSLSHTTAIADCQDWLWTQMLALMPSLEAWRQSISLKLQLPGVPWFSARARLALQFVPLTVHLSRPQSPPSESSDQTPLRDEPSGMPTARIWQADFDTRGEPLMTTPTSAESWVWRQRWLEADVTFLEPEDLQKAMLAAQAADLSWQFWHRQHPTTPEAIAPIDLVQASLRTLQPAANLTAQFDLSTQPLAELCVQLKWQWLRASRELITFIAGLKARRLCPQSPWEVGTVVILGQLWLTAPTGEVQSLDIATGDWMEDKPTLAATDMLHVLTAAPLARPLWTVADLTTYVNQQVQARSPILASLMTEQPITLTSPQDALFPETSPSQFQLKFCLVLDFLPQ